MQRRDGDGVEPAAIAASVDLAGKRILDVGCGTGRLTASPRREQRTSTPSTRTL
jgi:2-polyprenyl-3-methyl-5-hydroxy-6-metoxy-1,4-benzoquinol methylase